MLKNATLSLLLVLTLGACNTSNQHVNNAPRFSASITSKMLESGITESEIGKRTGWKPNKAEMSTCGTSTSSPWRCKILTYGVSYDNMLVVHLIPDAPGGESIVNSWFVLGNN
jgi:hypothetical protein